MMEVFSLHREMTGEEGEQCRVRYSLTEDSCGPERCYGILCCVARREVTPVQLEDILVELLP